MVPMGFQTLYLLFIVFVLSFIWKDSFSLTAALEFALALLCGVIIFQSWNQQRLLQAITDDDLIGRRRGIGLWEKIFRQLEIKSTSWRHQLFLAEREYSKFVQAVQASPNGLVMLGESDQIEWCNHICRVHFRIDPLRDAGQPITFLLRHPDFVKYMQAKIFSEPLHLEYMGTNGNLNLLLQVYPYGENRKLLLSQDISLLKRNEAIRQDFVANVSHELRTPLTVLNGFLETIREIPLSENERKRYLHMMSAQSSRMLSLVEELLILTRLDNSPTSHKNNEIKIPEMMTRLIEDARNLSNGNHIIRHHLNSTKNIYGAENEIFSAFSNLITNSIRYTPEGGTIQLSWTDEEDGGATFTVFDTGIGIAPEHIPRLTERFYRVDRSRSRDTGGTGLGLAIVKHVAIRHEAELQIKSTLSVGSEFSIRFTKERVGPSFI